MKLNRYAWSLLACSLTLSLPLFAQTIIVLSNPSFESASTNVDVVPPGWNSFSTNKKGFPDLLTHDSGINTQPKDGKVFLGLRTKRNEIYEGVTQQLSAPLLKDSVYLMNIWLAHASTYSVPTQKRGKQQGVTSSAGITKLTVFGVNTTTRKQELLVETTPVDHDTWRNYTLLLNPKTMNCNQLILSTAYTLKNPKQEGNLLLDNCSDIQLLTGGKRGDLYGSAKEQHPNTGAPGQIMLLNPSFETFVYALEPLPQYWDDKGAKNMTPPDVQPGANYVTNSPQHGRYYLSMVTRADGTKEAIGQQLSEKLDKGVSYKFSLWLAHSRDFESRTKEGRALPFSKPILLQIWGINTKTGAKQLLASSPTIDSNRWVEYFFKLTPANSDVDYLMLEAVHDPNAKTAYYGHLLIDNCSSITKYR